MLVLSYMTLLTEVVQLSNSSATAQLRGPARCIKLQVSSQREKAVLVYAMQAVPDAARVCSRFLSHASNSSAACCR